MNVGDRLYVKTGPYAGHYATVAKTVTDTGWPMVTARVDNVRGSTGYSFDQRGVTALPDRRTERPNTQDGRS